MFLVIVLCSINPDMAMEEVHVDCVLIDTLVLSDFFKLYYCLGCAGTLRQLLVS